MFRTHTYAILGVDFGHQAEMFIEKFSWTASGLQPVFCLLTEGEDGDVLEFSVTVSGEWDDIFAILDLYRGIYGIAFCEVRHV